MFHSKNQPVPPGIDPLASAPTAADAYDEARDGKLPPLEADSGAPSSQHPSRHPSQHPPQNLPQHSLGHFFAQRFSNYDFMGLPFTILVSVLILIPALYPLVQHLLDAGLSLTIDRVFNKLMLCVRTPALVNLAVWVTYLGSRIMVASLTVVMMIIFWLRNKKPFIIPMGVSVVGSAIFMTLGKLLYYRPRPLNAVYTELTLSYPSGHATLAIACYGFITYFLWRNAATRRGRRLVLLAGILVSGSIAFSRLYLGVHFMSDVWSGVLLGSGWLAVAISSAEWRFNHVKREPSEGFRTRQVKWAIGGLLAAELVLFIFLAGRFSAAVLPKGATVALLTIEGRVKPAPASGTGAPNTAVVGPPTAGTATTTTVPPPTPATDPVAAAAQPRASAPAPAPPIPAPAAVDTAVSGLNAAVAPAQPVIPPKVVGSVWSTSLLAKNHLPEFTESLTTTTQEPLNFIIVGNEITLLKAFQQGGWTAAEALGVSNVFRLVSSVVLNRPYPQAPLTPSFWNGQPHVFGFEKPGAQNSVRERHHARFWRTNLRTPDGQIVYTGTASFDIGMKWGGFTHTISPDIDAERELLFTDLQKGGEVADFEKRPLVRPQTGKNAAGDSFFTDGQAYTVYLK